MAMPPPGGGRPLPPATGASARNQASTPVPTDAAAFGRFLSPGTEATSPTRPADTEPLSPAQALTLGMLYLALREQPTDTALRERACRWLEQGNTEHPKRARHLVPGYSSRSRPWLASQNSTHLPTLDRQHEMLLQLHNFTPPQAQAQQRWRQREQEAHQQFAASLIYSLHDQMIEASQLSLRPATINWHPDDRAHAYSFSLCSRWLAVMCSQGGQLKTVLQVYGWQDGSWQKERLVNAPDIHLTSFTFIETVPSTLVTLNTYDLFVWKRQPDSPHWQASRLWQQESPFWVPLTLQSMANGDLIVMCTNAFIRCTENRFLFFNYQSGNKSWARPPASHSYDHGWIASAYSDLACKMALARPTAEGASLGNQIQVWAKGLRADQPEQWSRQTSQLRPGLASVHQISFTPDNNLLLGLLADGTVCLWGLDARCQLQERLTVATGFDPQAVRLDALRSFRGDGKQVAIALSHRIEFWNAQEDGHWQQGDLIEAPPARADEELRDMLLTDNGQTLVRLSTDRIHIWHRGGDNRWQQLVQRETRSPQDPMPAACLLGRNQTVCTTASDPQLSLWIHGPDREGNLVRKACIPVATPIHYRSADGLSLSLYPRGGMPHFLQMLPPTTPDRPREEREPQQN
ncbi:MAG: hypothetical protein OXC07_04395 [Kistimonas sp.]|nr:hypothetical protein [Kistimonas sp.]